MAVGVGADRALLSNIVCAQRLMTRHIHTHVIFTPRALDILASSKTPKAPPKTPKAPDGTSGTPPRTAEGGDGEGGGSAGGGAGDGGPPEPPPVVPEMPPSWVPKLSIARDAFDMKCPRGSRLTLYRRCQVGVYCVQ